MITLIVLWIGFGLVVGLMARALLPGRQPMTLLATTLLGIAGSFAGGMIGNLLFGAHVLELRSAGFVGSLLGAILVLVGIGAWRGRRLPA